MTLGAWILVGSVIAAVVLAILHALSASIRDFQAIQTLKADCARLRAEYAERLRMMQEQAAAAPLPDQLIEGEFDMIESRKPRKAA